MTAPLTPEQERAIRERLAGDKWPVLFGRHDMRLVLAALDAERARVEELEAQLDDRWYGAPEAARADLAEAQAELDAAKVVNRGLAGTIRAFEADNARLRVVLDKVCIGAESCMFCDGSGDNHTKRCALAAALGRAAGEKR